jgi:hypothetical protein
VKRKSKNKKSNDVECESTKEMVGRKYLRGGGKGRKEANFCRVFGVVFAPKHMPAA